MSGDLGAQLLLSFRTRPCQLLDFDSVRPKQRTSPSSQTLKIII